MAATYLCAQADCENAFEICKGIEWNMRIYCTEDCADTDRRYDEKHPNMSCAVCEKKVTAASVRFCGEGDGVMGCESWLCEECDNQGASCQPCLHQEWEPQVVEKERPTSHSDMHGEMMDELEAQD